MGIMSTHPKYARLSSRSLISVSGEDWRSFLQGLLTQDVETLTVGEVRFAALLTPQGRLLYDLFVVGCEDGCLIDCAAEHRAGLMQKLKMYRLRAKVSLAEDERPVMAFWGGDPETPGWAADGRAPALGLRGYGAPIPDGAEPADEATYDAHVFAVGAPGPADWGFDKTYPIEANFDLLGGIDFKKGCFVGQETTSRMKRRGVIKNRMAPILFHGPPPAPGARVACGGLDAGAIASGREGGAMAVLRLERLAEGPMTLDDGRPAHVAWPEWMGEAAPRS